MIIKTLRLTAVKKRIARLVKNRQQEPYNVPIRSIKIIIDHENLLALPELKKISSCLKLPDPGVNVVLYSEDPKTSIDFEGLRYSFQDITFMAEINNKNLTKFASESVDILITFAQENNTAVHLLTAHCNAGIKVGRFQKNETLYDIVLKCENDAELFTAELIKYFKQLKKIENE